MEGSCFGGCCFKGFRDGRFTGELSKHYPSGKSCFVISSEKSHILKIMLTIHWFLTYKSFYFVVGDNALFVQNMSDTFICRNIAHSGYNLESGHKKTSVKSLETFTVKDFSACVISSRINRISGLNL